MYIPSINRATERNEIIAFMRRFGFATIVSVSKNLPVATHLPFLVTERDGALILTAHFAKANDQWMDITNQPVLVIFSEPHAYISPNNYEQVLNVPTWNYISVHAYGNVQLITSTNQVFELLESTINHYELAYRQQWDHFPEDYKIKMAKGIVAFEVVVTDLQAKQKLSQNRTAGEQQKIIDTLDASDNSNEQLVAAYMKKNQ